MAASYLMLEAGRAAFVDAGTGHSPPRLLAALQKAQVGCEQVDWVIVTHVHLDHAGGAGRLMQALPNARLVVHPRGARHMQDPSKLIQGATAVYGEAEMWRQFGDVLATPEERIVIAEDGDTLSLNGRELVFMDSPGHARHHFCIWDENSRGWFAGDSFGMSYRNFDTANGPFIFPTTTPIDFDPGAMHDTIEKMLARDPVCIYLTHYGRVENPAPLAQDMHRRVDGLVEIAERNEGAEDCAACIAQEVETWLMDEAVTHGVDLPAARLRELLATDIELNTQGLVVWLQRRRKA